MSPTEEDVKAYIAQLTEQERIIFEIAKEHLETSFDIVRSIGFVEWFELYTKLPQIYNSEQSV